MKKLLALVLALAMVLSMAACGSQPGTSSTADTKEQTTTQAPTESTPAATEPAQTEPASTVPEVIAMQEPSKTAQSSILFFIEKPPVK